jgi:hypothetical protein
MDGAFMSTRERQVEPIRALEPCLLTLVWSRAEQYCASAGGMSGSSALYVMVDEEGMEETRNPLFIFWSPT